jgi:uncharacterized protein
MKCPICTVELRIVDRQGIEVDYCPTCRGVWLDRGELDKIIERAGPAAPTAPYAGSPADDSDVRHPSQNVPNFGWGPRQRHPPKKRGSFLRELFDFG